MLDGFEYGVESKKTPVVEARKAQTQKLCKFIIRQQRTKSEVPNNFLRT